MIHHDGTHKVLMNLIGHPNHESSVRKYAEGTGKGENRDSTGRLRAVNTPTTSQGSEIGVEAEFREKRSIAQKFLDRTRVGGVR